MGPIFRFSRVNQDFTVMAGHEANLFMTREAGAVLRADLVRREQNEEFGIEKTLVTMNGEEHYAFRKLQKRGHARSALDRHYTALVGITERIARGWQPGDRLLVRDFFPQMIAEQLGIGVVNYPIGDYFKDVLLFVRTALTETVVKTRPRSVINSPKYKRAKARSMELADKVIAAHRTAPTNGRKPDLVDDLLAAMAEDETLMTEQELRIAVLGGYIGGLDTVAYTCTFMLHALLDHPEVLARATAEADAAFADGMLTPQKLKDMPVLHHAALEVLRLYPVAAAIQGTVGKSFEFAGYRVEEGQDLIVATTVQHFLPEFFPNPLTFDVDRYDDPACRYREPGVLMPFGVGPHICLGAGMAEVLIMLTMATLLRTVQLAMDPPDYRLNIQTVPSPVPFDFHVRVVAQRP
jgi:cytochrome P450